MTLREIRIALSKVDLNTPMFTIASNNVNQALGLIAFRQRMSQFQSVPFFQEEKARIFSSPLFQTVTDILNHDGSQLVSLLRTAESIRLGAKALRDAIGTLLPDGDESTIVVKLPDSEDLNEIVGYLSAFQKAISNNVINEDIHGQVSVKNWQPGSLWLDIYLGVPAAVGLVGGMAWAAAVVRKKWNEGSIVEKFVESMDIKNQMLDSLRTGVDEHVKLIIEAEAKNLFASSFKDSSNHEQIERLKMGIKEFAKLIQKGAEIHPALMVPENVKNLFPDFSKLDTIESKQKLIRDGNPPEAKP